MHGGQYLLWIIVIAIFAGIVSQIFSLIIGIPSIVILLISGIVLGPEVLGFLNPRELGTGFETIIRLCVAIILFEAGLNLDRAEIKKHQKVIVPLITYGALITMVLGALFSILILDLTLSQAFLFGSLVIVTGPTVIHPLLKKMKVKSKLKNILEYEGVFIDPIGAIIAIFVFELVIEESNSFMPGLFLVFFRLGLGLVIGSVCGFIVGMIVKKWSLFMEDYVELFVLASALGIYALSEAFIVESGLMAAVASGAVFGNMHIPEEGNLRKFKGKISVLVISLLFVLLAANLELKYITSLGLGGILVVLALLFLVRPIEIFICTLRSDFNIREKAFLSYISPRGIIAASVASISAIKLRDKGIEGGGDIIQGLVFLTIGLSVVFQGLTANTVASKLGVIVDYKRTIIVGASAFGRLIGKVLKLYNRDVGFIDTNEYLVQKAFLEGFEAIEGNSLDLDNLENIGIDRADSLLALTTSNKVNILVSRLAKIEFGIKNSYPILNKFREDFDEQSIEKLGLVVAFGKSFDMYEINPKIARGEYRIKECTIGETLTKDKMEELTICESLIPLLIIRENAKEPYFFTGENYFEKDNKLIILDIKGDSSLLNKLGFVHIKMLEL